MTTYELLARYDTGAAVRVGCLALLVLVLRLVSLPLAVLTLLAERAVAALSAVAASIVSAPVDVADGRCPR